MKTRPGTPSPPAVSAAGPAPLSARPATASTSLTKGPRRAASGARTGMPAASGSSPIMPRGTTPATSSPSATATASCTSSSTTTTSSARPSAPAAADVSASARWGSISPRSWKTSARNKRSNLPQRHRDTEKIKDKQREENKQKSFKGVNQESFTSDFTLKMLVFLFVFLCTSVSLWQKGFTHV